MRVKGPVDLETYFTQYQGIFEGIRMIVGASEVITDTRPHPQFQKRIPWHAGAIVAVLASGVAPRDGELRL